MEPLGVAGISALALAGAMILSACVAPAGALNKGVEDRSQDQIEQMRSRFAPAATPDTSYDQIEEVALTLRSRWPGGHELRADRADSGSRVRPG